MSDAEVIEALTTSVKDLDNSRKVGWATAFGKDEKLQDALRDLNAARADTEIWRKAASYLHGYLLAVEDRLPGMHSTIGPKDRKRYLSALGIAGIGTQKDAGRSDGEMVMDEWLEAQKDRVPILMAKSAAKRERRAAERTHREMIEGMATNYHATPAVMRATLKAMRGALRGHGQGVAEAQGMRIRVIIES